MRPRLTSDEAKKLGRLLEIMRDESRLPGERRIAMAQFDRIYEMALKRTSGGKKPKQLA